MGIGNLTAREKKVMIEIVKGYKEKGLIIEAGWEQLKYLSIPDDTPQTLVDAMRKMFFSGALYVFGRVADEENNDDISLIRNELKTYFEEVQKELRSKAG